VTASSSRPGSGRRLETIETAPDPAGSEAATARCASERQRHFLRFAPGGTISTGPGAEELDPPSYRVRRALPSVAPRPLPEHQPAADRDLPALDEMDGTGLGLTPERGYIDVGRFAPFTAATGVVDREPQLTDRATATDLLLLTRDRASGARSGRRCSSAPPSLAKATGNRGDARPPSRPALQLFHPQSVSSPCERNRCNHPLTGER
jgi:hypothetical protein